MLSIREEQIVDTFIDKHLTQHEVDCILYVSETEAEDLQRFEINTSTEKQNSKTIKVMDIHQRLLPSISSASANST